MKSQHLVGVLLLLLAGCRDTGTAPPPVAAEAGPAASAEAAATAPLLPSPSPVEIPMGYRCADAFAFQVRYDENEAVLLLEGGARVLQQVVTASGARYEGEDAMLWNKGSEASLQLDGQSHEHCREQQQDTQPPRLPAFTAQGNEPGWRLQIRPGDRMELLADYGETTVETPAPPALPDGTATVYHARNAAHELSVRIEPTPCQDDMSGARYSATVTVRLDGRALHGCGGTMTAAPGG